MRDAADDDRESLQDILERLQRIRDFAQAGQSEFLESVMMQDAVIRNFEVMDEATKRLSAALRQRYPQVAWREMAAFRDVLIHNYGDVRLDTVWVAIEESLPPLEKQLLEILQDLDNETQNQ